MEGLAKGWASFNYCVCKGFTTGWLTDISSLSERYICANAPVIRGRRKLEYRKIKGRNYSKGIGCLSLRDGKRRCQVVQEIIVVMESWLRDKSLDADVWTDLPSNF